MISRENYHDVIEYQQYLIDVMQRDTAVVDQVYRFWLRNLLVWCDATPFPQAARVRPTLPRYLADKNYSVSTAKHICAAARGFFTWAMQYHPERCAGISPAWIATLQPPRPKEKIAEHRFVSIEMVRALMTMPQTTLAIQRDVAAAAFLFLSGMRAGAFVTMPIQAVDLSRRLIQQSPALGMHTKLGKAAVTRLLEIPDLIAVVEKWDAFIRAAMPTNALWYPVLQESFGELNIVDARAGRWRTKTLNANLQLLFKLAGIPSLSAHKFRHGHAVYALQHAKDIGDLKAISQNLMHSSITTTDSIYAILPREDVHARIGRL